MIFVLVTVTKMEHVTLLKNVPQEAELQRELALKDMEFVVSVSTLWDHCGTIVGPLWDNCGTIVGQLLDHWRTFVGLFCDH